ncbi:MAG: histidine kinase, partial [Bacteroidaceae bacterium]|nr:histidine kinase [Bacteroidaceae bacterium]
TTDKMINALSSLFRYNLKTQSPMVSLSQEIKVVNDYMYLQQMRFGDRITYEINCSDEVSLEMIPPFTLQPLVENSIIHGLSVKEEGGHISIDVDSQDGFLIIVVKDTGVGMDEMEMKELMEEWDRGKGKFKGIGLGNIKRRIEDLYKDGRVMVTSVKGQGTTITIEIPQTKEKD